MTWADHAACRNHQDMWAFFADEQSQKKIAIPICNGCPVSEECLQAAIDGRETEGVWGGLMPAQIKQVAGRRWRAA